MVSLRPYMAIPSEEKFWPSDLDHDLWRTFQKRFNYWYCNLHTNYDRTLDIVWILWKSWTVILTFDLHLKNLIISCNLPFIVGLWRFIWFIVVILSQRKQHFWLHDPTMTFDLHFKYIISAYCCCHKCSLRNSKLISLALLTSDWAHFGLLFFYF